uniref:Haloacid dehalogenase like hydrolase domain containing 5 n=1 Tax=Amphiprion percula TaxID=161767 RepID=A0A3P8U617_AMPPE
TFLLEKDRDRQNIFNLHAGVLFDVDGVLLRGRSVLPGARRALRKLLDQNNNFLFPVVFVTNAGSCQRQDKAEAAVQSQVVLSHSPLQMMKSFHDRCVMVCGQGPTTSIKVLSIEQLAQQHPLLDMVDHQRKPTPPVSTAITVPVTIILFGEPIKWETNLQLLIDLPILACNMDLLWMAEPSPRFGHGMFLLCLESVYRKLTGQELRYEALLGKPSLLTYQYAEQLLRLQNHNRKLTTVYAVGDNLLTDIYGANLYNRYLAQQHIAMTTAAKLVAQGTGSQVTTAEEEVVCAAQCRSILVCTGVYDPRSLLPGDQNSGVSETVFHGHRDLALEPDLVEPSHMVKDVEAAVDLLLQQEKTEEVTAL